MYKLVLFVVIFSLFGCASNKYVGVAANNYAGLSCALDAMPCRINFSKEGYISYQVTEIAPNKYRVTGNVDLYMEIVGGMYPRISFYILFMDDTEVKFERKLKTGTRKATFDFEFETTAPINKTTIENVIYHVWS